MSSQKKYDASFTAGGLLYTEFKSLIGILSSPDFEELINAEEQENKVIAIPTSAARKRIIPQIIRRHKQAPIDFWDFFNEISDYEKKFCLFFLCLKTYPLLMDLHLEVTLKKFRTGVNLETYDIQMRLEELMSYHEEVSSWADSTLKKVNTRYIRMLKDLEIYNGNILTRPVKARAEFWNYFKETNEQWFLEACFIAKK